MWGEIGADQPDPGQVQVAAGRGEKDIAVAGAGPAFLKRDERQVFEAVQLLIARPGCGQVTKESLQPVDRPLFQPVRIFFQDFDQFAQLSHKCHTQAL